jgi:hypothetical protein
MRGITMITSEPIMLEDDDLDHVTGGSAFAFGGVGAIGGGVFGDDNEDNDVEDNEAENDDVEVKDNDIEAED